MIAGIFACYILSGSMYLAKREAGGKFRAGKHIIDARSWVGSGIGVAELVGMEMAETIGIASIQQQINSALCITIPHYIQQCCAWRSTQECFNQRQYNSPAHCVCNALVG